MDWEVRQKLAGNYNINSSKDRIFYESQKDFNNRLQYGLDVFSVKIDNQKDKIQAIIQDHTNPLNEYKEDRKLMIDSAVSIHRGSVVEVGTDKYIVITDIDDNGVYKTCKMLKTYNTLKWKDEIGTIVELPCIVSNFTLYSDGLEIGKYMITEDGKRAVIVSSTSDTLKKKQPMRFIFNHNSVFKVTDIDDYSMVGILNIVMAQDVFINDDDKEQNIAVNVYDTTPAPEPPPVDLAISGSDEIKIGSSQDYTIVNNTNYTFLWSVNSNKVTIINFNTISCTLSAVFDSNNVGTVVTLTAIAQENSSIVLTKDITIKGIF